MINLKYRKPFLWIITVISIICAISAINLKFRFDFEQFFPEGDEDLEFYRDFIKSFETDDNFLLIGLPHDKDVFNRNFLSRLKRLTLEIRPIGGIQKVQSIANLRYPVKTPFGITTKPMIHVEDESYYPSDKSALMNDPRFVNTLISKDGKSVVIVVKTIPGLTIKESDKMMAEVTDKIKELQFPKYHFLGRANFQHEIIKIQQKEFIFCSLISLFVVVLIIKLLYKRWMVVGITVACVMISLSVFVGFLSFFGRELSLVSALYPVIILIVTTSDVIHIITKYLGELNKGFGNQDCIDKTMAEVGQSTFITSATTSLGFVSLLTSKLIPVQDLGLNCAIGVMLAYGVTIPLSLYLLSSFDRNKLIAPPSKYMFWQEYVMKIYGQTISGRRLVGIITGLVIGLSFWGMTKISTNYSIQKTLSLKEKVGQDFLYFEKNFNGFRPLEFAILPKSPFKATDYEVVKEIDKIENHLQETGVLGNILSIATLHKSLYMVFNDNTRDSFKLPYSTELFSEQQALIEKMGNTESSIMISKEGDKTRISSRALDIGADSVRILSGKIDEWISKNINSDIIRVKQTGTGLILDKNSLYVKNSLLTGLAISIFLISVLMAWMLKEWKMFIVSLIPNLIPILFVAGLLGWLKIDLEAGISIIFGVIYGIVVDDTIHFLGRYNIARKQGLDIEESIKITFVETGKAMVFTTIILFSAFLVMLFTTQPLTKVVGILLSVTFVVAVYCDLYLIPILIRLLYKSKAIL
jgi:uncharacterized protein